VDLADRLLKQYRDYCSSLGLTTTAFTPKVSQMTRYDNQVGASSPFAFAPIPPGISLSLELDAPNNKLKILWATAPFAEFGSFAIFFDTGSSQIADRFSGGEWPGIRLDLHANPTISRDPNLRHAFVTLDEAPGTTVRVLVACRSLMSKVKLSNEAVITLPA